jgi:hypothetical protein
MKKRLTLKALTNPRYDYATLSALGTNWEALDPRVVASSNPGLGLTNAFTVFCLS